MRLRVAIFVVTFVTFPLLAGLNRWTLDGPAGGKVNQFTADPAIPSTLYAATPQFTVALQVGVSPSNADVVYLDTTQGGLRTSTDGGLTFGPAGTGLAVATIFRDTRRNTDS